MENQIRALFDDYERAFNAALVVPRSVSLASLRRAFASYFVASSPLGVAGGKNGLLFRLMMGRGFARYRRLGMRLMRLQALDVTPIDRQHALARVGWHSEYQKREQRVSIDFDVSYLVRLGDEGPRIVAFVTGDEEKALREHGLLGAVGETCRCSSPAPAARHQPDGAIQNRAPYPITGASPSRAKRSSSSNSS